MSSKDGVGDGGRGGGTARAYDFGPYFITRTAPVNLWNFGGRNQTQKRRKSAARDEGKKKLSKFLRLVCLLTPGSACCLSYPYKETRTSCKWNVEAIPPRGRCFNNVEDLGVMNAVRRMQHLRNGKTFPHSSSIPVPLMSGSPFVFFDAPRH